jgi:hypothetical protein
MCCGQKRSEFQNSQPPRTAPNVPQQLGSRRTQAIRTQPSAPLATVTSPPTKPGIPQTASPHQHSANPTPFSSISVRYLERSPVRVRGLVSGMSYEFSGSRPVQSVDSRDASSLLNTRFFRRA